MQKKYPFKFLDAYTRDDRDIFLGRDEEIEMLYQMLFQTDLIVVYGASGTGKTSLIKCGLASKFQPYEWLALSVRRGDNINTSLDVELADAGLDKAGSAAAQNLDWLDQSRKPGPASAGKSAVADRLKSLYLRHFKPVFLIFDQFEELYILGDRKEQDAFVETVRTIMLMEQPVKIILSIREEYLGYLYEFERKVPELLRKKIRIEPMNLDKVSSVIQGIGKLEQSNVSLRKGEEQDVATAIFNKLKDRENTRTIELPYLQVLLDKIYLSITSDKTRVKEAEISLKAVEKIGDIGDVLRNFLDEQVLDIGKRYNKPPEEIWKLLSPFVTLDGTKEPLTIDQFRDKFSDLEKDYLDKCIAEFQQSRILRFDEKEQRYEVAHDSLARQIAAKRTDEEIALLEAQRLIRSQTAMKIENRDYFSANQLALIEPILDKLNLEPEEQDWVTKSKTFREEERTAKEKEQRDKLDTARKQLNIVRGLLGAALIAVGIAVYFGWQARQQERIANESAEKERKSAEERRVALEKFELADKQRKETEINTLLSKYHTNLNLNQPKMARINLEDALKIDSTREDIKELLRQLQSQK